MSFIILSLIKQVETNNTCWYQFENAKNVKRKSKNNLIKKGVRISNHIEIASIFLQHFDFVPNKNSECIELAMVCMIDTHVVAAVVIEHWLFGFCCSDWYLHLQYRCIPCKSYCRSVCWQIYEYVISKNRITNNFIIAFSLAVGHQLLFCVQTFLFAFLYI